MKEEEIKLNENEEQEVNNDPENNEIDNNEEVNNVPENNDQVDNDVQDEINNQVNNNEKPEEYDITFENIGYSDENGNKYLGTQKERLNKVEQAKRAYAAQTSKEDKLLYYINYAVKNDALERHPFENIVLEIPAGTDPVKREKMINDVNQKLSEAATKRMDAGMHPYNNCSDEEGDYAIELCDQVIMDLIGDGSMEQVMDGINSLSVLTAWNVYRQGKEFNRVLETFDKDDPNREKKAFYLLYKRDNSEGALADGVITNLGTELISGITYTNNIGQTKIQDKVFENLHYEKENTTLNQFFNKLKFNEHERLLFITNNGLTGEEKLYDAFKFILETKGELDEKKIKEGLDLAEDVDPEVLNSKIQEAIDQKIYDEIYAQYTDEFSKIVLSDGMGGPLKKFEQVFCKNMTVAHYMSILHLDKEEDRKDFLAAYNTTPDAKVYGLFYGMLDKDEVYKAKLFHDKEKDNKPQEIADDDVKKYAGEIMQAEFANKRRKIKKFEDTYSENMNLKTFFDIIDLSEFARMNLLSDFAVDDGAKVSVVFKKELLEDDDYREKNLNGKSDEEISDEDVKAYAKNFLIARVNMQIEKGSYAMKHAVLHNLALTFSENLDPVDKVIYSKGQIIKGGEDLVPKNHPKNPTEQAFKDWVEDAENGAVKILQDARVDDTIKAFKSANSKIYVKAAMNLRNDPQVTGYYDGKVTVSNTTFLKAVITELEATKTGKHYFRSKTERSSNSTEYDNMLRALKEYYKKLVTDDKAGLLEAKNALKDYCKEYIKDKYTERKRDFGKVRFDAAMTLLYDLMPRKDFRDLVRAVNDERGAVGRNDPKAVSTDMYNTKYVEYYSAEEAKEEERQAAAEADKIRTDMPEDYQGRFMNVMNVFSPSPICNEELKEVFGDNFNNKFPNIEEKFVAIGKGLKKRDLSTGDFAALGYAGTLTYNVGLIDNRYNKTWQINEKTNQVEYMADSELQINKALITGKDYTVALFKKPIPKDTAEYAAVIQGGRDAAANAMRQYAKGDTYQLVNVIASGIRNIAAMCRLSKEINEDFICNAEMGKRLVEMLDRDEGLKVKVMAEYDAEPADIKYISSICQVAKIYTKHIKAMGELLDAVSNKQELTEEKKLDLVTDILMSKVIAGGKDSFNKHMDNAVKNKPTAKMKEVLDEAKKIDDIWTDKILEAKDNEERQPMYKESEAHKELRVLIAKDFMREDKLIKSLTSDASVEALKKSVKDLAKESGFAKLSPDEIINKMNNPKVVQKLATVTKNANEKAAEQLSKEFDAAKNERIKAQQAAHKRAQKLGRHH